MRKTVLAAADACTFPGSDVAPTIVVAASSGTSMAAAGAVALILEQAPVAVPAGRQRESTC